MPHRRIAHPTKLTTRGDDFRIKHFINRSAQSQVGVTDDASGHTLAAASTLEKDVRSGLKTGADIDAASAVGKVIAERAKSAGVEQVVFDRGSYLYHGRVKALAEAACEGGLEF